MHTEAPVLGFALGGGAVRGLAHLGALRAFARSGLCPDVICGTSSGAIIAGAIASGTSADELIPVALRLRWSELLKVRVGRDRLFDTSGLDDFIASVIPAHSFDDLHIAFASIAKDRLTGERVVLKRGDPSRAAAASAAIRRAFPPVKIDGRLLIDGCDVEPVPARAARELGATYVVGIDVLRTNVSRRSRARVNARAERDVDGCDLTITPALGSRSAWDFSKTSEIIALGESAADSAVEAIKTALTVAACGSA